MGNQLIALQEWLSQTKEDNISISVDFDAICKKQNDLLRNIKVNLHTMEKLLDKISGEWEYEDMIYRYYHHSFKVYRLQAVTTEIVDELRKISPHSGEWMFHRYFVDILKKGCIDREWTQSDNRKWQETTCPFVEAFLHAKFFLEMAIKYGKKYDKAPVLLDSGWAALLHLYRIR